MIIEPTQFTCYINFSCLQFFQLVDAVFKVKQFLLSCAINKAKFAFLLIFLRFLFVCFLVVIWLLLLFHSHV